MKTTIITISLAFIMLSFMGCKDNIDDTVDENLPDVDFPYQIVGTGQTDCFDNSLQISTPISGDAFYGQNGNYQGNIPSYVDNGDGTVTDMVSGMMWQQSCDFNEDGKVNVDDKMSYDEAVAFASTYNLAGYTDWRLPTIKEAYSLIMFYGLDPSGLSSSDGLTPFMDTNYFDIDYGDVDAGERIIDAQFASSNLYVSTTMNGAETMFGVNLADGRIKGYGTGPMPGQSADKQFYVLYVRGNSEYGINDFTDNSDGTITDNATNLMWMQNDSDTGMYWEDALLYAENATYAGYSDWRLPDTKELQSIIDYTRSPETTNSAAIDPLFNCTQILNENSVTDYPFYWSNTTHANYTSTPGSAAAYLCFGRAMGYMEGTWMDVHGAGSQRSDPKEGDPSLYPTGNGPQGDAIRIYNYSRLVRYVN